MTAPASAQLLDLRCVLAVRDLAAAAAFYRDMLGFRIESETEGWCFLSRGACRLMLGHCADALPAGSLGDHSWFAYVHVDDVDALHAEFTARGLPLATPADKPWGLRELLVMTPDGHRLMFGQALA